MIKLKHLLKVVFLVVFMNVMDEVYSAVREMQQWSSGQDDVHSYFHTVDTESHSPGSFKHQSIEPDSVPSVTVPQLRSGELAKIKSVPINVSFSRQKRSKGSETFVTTTEAPVRNPPPGPALIDWRTSPSYPRVRNQNEFGLCGCCWAFAAVGALEVLYSWHYQTRTHLSYQQLIDCCPGTNGCKGGKTIRALRYLVDIGVTLEEDYPFLGDKDTCDSDVPIIARAKAFQRVKNNEEAMVEALRRSPLVVSFFTPREMGRYRDGVINPANCHSEKKACTHAVVIVGHGEDYWIIRNSKGERYGYSGHCLLKKGTCGIGHKVWSITLDQPQQKPWDLVGMTKSYLSRFTGIGKIFYLKKAGICP